MANRKIADRSAQAEGTWYDTLPRSTKLPTVAGALIMAVMLMGFGVWGNMAPIAGAVVASSVFVVTGQNKIVQHLEGGRASGRSRSTCYMTGRDESFEGPPAGMILHAYSIRDAIARGLPELPCRQGHAGKGAGMMITMNRSDSGTERFSAPAE